MVIRNINLISGARWSLACVDVQWPLAAYDVSCLLDEWHLLFDDWTYTITVTVVIVWKHTEIDSWSVASVPNYNRYWSLETCATQMFHAYVGKTLEAVTMIQHKNMPELAKIPGKGTCRLQTV